MNLEELKRLFSEMGIANIGPYFKATMHDGFQADLAQAEAKHGHEDIRSIVLHIIYPFTFIHPRYGYTYAD